MRTLGGFQATGLVHRLCAIKFDYLAVFWGVAIIGGSGLLLWFPEFFARFLPG